MKEPCRAATPILAAIVVMSGSLLGCTSCPSPSSTTGVEGERITLDAAHPQAAHDLVVHAPEQTCGCTWCGDPILSLRLSGKVAWAAGEAASDPAVVRFEITPSFTPNLADTLDPRLPVDVVLSPDGTAAGPLIEATHLCPEDDVCDLRYRITVSRVDVMPKGTVSVSWSVGGSFVSKPDDAFRISVSP